MKQPLKFFDTALTPYLGDPTAWYASGHGGYEVRLKHDNWMCCTVATIFRDNQIVRTTHAFTPGQALMNLEFVITSEVREAFSIQELTFKGAKLTRDHDRTWYLRRGRGLVEFFPDGSGHVVINGRFIVNVSAGPDLQAQLDELERRFDDAVKVFDK